LLASPLLLEETGVTDHATDQDGFAFGNQVQADGDLGLGPGLILHQAGAGVNLELFFFFFEDPDSSQGGVKIMNQGGGAAVQGGIEGVPTGQGQADVFTESGEAGLLRGGPVGGAFSFEGVADRSFQ